MPNRSGGRKIYGWSTRQQGGFRKSGGPVKKVNSTTTPKQNVDVAGWEKLRKKADKTAKQIEAKKKFDRVNTFVYRDVEINSKKFLALMLSGEINIKTLKIKSLFNEVNDEEHIINEIEGNFFIAADGRKIPFDWLNIPNRVVVMEQKEDLKPILEKTKSESEKRDEKARELANEHNLPYQIVTTIPRKELGVFLKIFGDKACSPFDRRSAFSTSKKYNLHQHSLIGFEKNLKLVERLNNKPDPLGRMHLTFLFRHTGRLKECIMCSNVVEYERRRFPAEDKMLAIICTIRAACFLDIFDFHQDEGLLVIARKTINKAYAVSKNVKESSEQISLVYQRLEKLKGEVLTTKFKRKVNDGYGRWSDWVR